MSNSKLDKMEALKDLVKRQRLIIRDLKIENRKLRGSADQAIKDKLPPPIE